MNAIEKARKVIEMEQDGLRRLSANLDENFSRAIELLVAALQAQHKIVVIGVGKSGNIGHKIAATLNSTGATAVVLNSQNALHGDLGLVCRGDVVLAMSYSGETQELLTLLPHIKGLGCAVIAMTGNPSSTLAEYATLTLNTSVEREACPLNLAPTTSSTSMLVLGDALAMVLLEARGFTEEDFARYHPGGSLGRALLTKVEDIMRKGVELAAVGVGATVNDAIVEMSRARCGACVVVEEDGGLAGIFTHGDFVRSYQKNPMLGACLVRDFMTKRPVTIFAGALAAEAIHTLGANRIDDIPVLDELGKVVGLLDTQDLARAKIS